MTWRTPPPTLGGRLTTFRLPALVCDEITRVARERHVGVDRLVTQILAAGLGCADELDHPHPPTAA